MENFSLVEKLFGKPYTETKNVLGKQIQFRVLSNPERVQIWRKYPTTDLLTAPETIAIPTLARAIVTIDGVALAQFREIRDLAKVLPETSTIDLIEKHFSDQDLYPFTIINELYTAYTEVVGNHQIALAELKKNSAVATPELSGSSAEPSNATPPPSENV
jgi:hypothetical protein